MLDCFSAEKKFIEWGLKCRPNLIRPSIGRIDHDEDYTLDNIEWQELNENMRKKCNQMDVERGYYYCPGGCKTIYERTPEFFYRNRAQSDGLACQCKKCDDRRRRS